MALKFINITEDEFLSKKLLHKFMPLEYALETLNNKHLWFANPTTWKDPFEKRFIDATYKSLNGELHKFTWRDRVFCICMTQTATSEAYWNTYSPHSIGVELKFIRKKLLDVLKQLAENYDIFIGKVEYMKTADIQKALSNIPFNPPCNHNIRTKECRARLLLLKRIAYKYEDEIRIMIIKKNITKGKGIYIDYVCDNVEMIDSITLDPTLEKNVTKLLKDIFVNHYGFTPISTGNSKKFRVQKSSLYTDVKPVEITIR